MYNPIYDSYTGEDIREMLKATLKRYGIPYSEEIFQDCMNTLIDQFFRTEYELEKAIEQYVKKRKGE